MSLLRAGTGGSVGSSLHQAPSGLASVTEERRAASTGPLPCLGGEAGAAGMLRSAALPPGGGGGGAAPRTSPDDEEAPGAAGGLSLSASLSIGGIYLRRSIFRVISVFGAVMR
jgi:hypothetical protein